VAEEAEPNARKPWPSHNYDPRQVERPEPRPEAGLPARFEGPPGGSSSAAKWLHSLEGAETGTAQDAWRRGETLHRAFPQLTRKPAAVAPPLSSEEAARLEAQFAESRRKRKVLVRVALLMVWGALLVTLATLYLAAT
jgi:ferric-dicitrate binding protein FerR (iron transport regulator)